MRNDETKFGSVASYDTWPGNEVPGLLYVSSYRTQDENKRLHKNFVSGWVSKLVSYSIGIPRILQWRGFTWWGAGPRDLGDGSPPVGSRGKAPEWSLGDKVPRS